MPTQYRYSNHDCTVLCGQVWYMVPMSWWTSWHNYVNWEQSSAQLLPNGTLGRKKGGSVVATDTSSQVVATGGRPGAGMYRVFFRGLWIRIHFPSLPNRILEEKGKINSMKNVRNLYR